MSADYPTPHSSRKWRTSNLTPDQFIDRHFVECEICHRDPLDCPILETLVDDLLAQPYESALDRRIENRPEYRGTGRSVWFEEWLN